MRIANIISESQLNLNDNFNVIDNEDDIDSSIPTLLIGFDRVSDIDDLDMMDRQLDDLTYWTFTKKERRDMHNQDLIKFMEFAYQQVVDDIQYIYIDPIHDKLNKLKKIIHKIKSFKEVYSYQFGDMIYIYSDKLIFGVDLRILKFIGIDPNKVKKKIQRLSKVFLDNDEILIEYKEFMERLDDEVKYIPYLYSISNG
jgi:hypothetical protein